ncbi:hypothetical protein COR50_20795 [Chitinophaga caeni]|uniref:Uncharacterized protein n=1 Tax=Chitinophaga caeni TaxID=2029983 RepID=A0A291QZN7_9BACT|nr:hypothetical protein [Chitinophaga caeni]ATL49417.1 hypothetical protein COR50_20795 [Chitinophaga caeni]
MKKILLFIGATGLLMAVLAYFADMYAWLSKDIIVPVGFSGYVLMITAVAYFLLAWMYKWSQ